MGDGGRVKLLAGRRAEVASYLVVALVASLMVVLAVRSDGYSRHRVDLNDGGVWVSSGKDKSYGRVNKPIDEIDAVARVPAASGPAVVDVVQQGAAVAGLNAATSELYAMDVFNSLIPEGAATTIAPQSDVEMLGGTLGVVDRASGKVWATKADEVLGLSSVAEVESTSKPLQIVGPHAGGTVLADGSVVAASAEADRLLVLPAVEGGWGKPVTSEIGLTGEPLLTAVGQVPVVLDSETGQLFLDSGQSTTVVKGAVLQQPGPAAKDVLVTTPTDLLSVDLETGEATVLSRHEGVPAAAIRIGDCAYAAWSGSGSTAGFVVTRCGAADELGYPIGGDDLVLRTNRGEVMLNDRTSGAVWNIDNDKPQQVDNWENFAPQRRKLDDGDKEQQDDPLADEQPPRPKSDELGARPGTTTVLHVLDNDQAPNGRLLAISRVGLPSIPDATVRVSPDGQTILIEIPEHVSGTIGFQYWVNAGNDKDVPARVTVPVRDPGAQQPPQLRDGLDLVPASAYVVPARGSVTVSVLGDWRDPHEGDAVSLTNASVGRGRVNVTAAGQIRFEAPQNGGQESIDYTVTDSAGGVAQESVKVTVQGPKVIEATSPSAQPDLGRGVVGAPILIRPLANDIPGSDPLDRSAKLVLAAPVVEQSGLQVTSDQVSGELTVTGSRPGSFQLSYLAGFGDAAPSPAVIRVDIDPPPDDKAPITVPDAITLFGTSQGVVDVLANDYDPQGRVLVTQRAELLGPAEPIEVSVIDGHWVRLRAIGPTSRNPLTVRYTVSNGNRGGVTGDIVVRLSDPLSGLRDQPVTTDDYATVRAGGGVVMPVLDNDFTPSGAPVSLLAGGTDKADGRLDVTPRLGEASVSGRLLRYVAPSDVESAQTVDVEYYATNSNGASEIGVAHVTITPRPSKSLVNQPPTPPNVEARVVAGDTVKIKIPAGSADPDGDAVTVTGLGSATSLGRVLKFGATEVQYQAFPSSAGTDSFTYVVTDPYGGTAQGTMRVAVVAPDEAQPPVAVDDTILAAPGRQVTVRVTSNDYVGAGDLVEVLPLEETNAQLPEGVDLVTPAGPVVVTAGERVVGLDYRISNGITSSLGRLTVRTVKGYNNPPVVVDAYGRLDGQADTVTVDVLEKAYDPDGDAADLVLSHVAPSAAGEVTTRRSGRVTVPLADYPQVLPYTAVDPDGAVASAFLYVPAKLVEAPYLLATDPIALDRGGRLELDLTDYVADPEGRPVRLTTRQSDQSAAPATALTLVAKDKSTLTLSAVDPDYIGPGAITFEVTNGAGLSDADAATAVFTLPVQVGKDQPVFRCPDTALTLNAGGLPISPDIAALCHVWTPDPEVALEIEARAVSPSLRDLVITQPGGSVVELRAPGGMSPTENAGDIEVSDPASGASDLLKLSVVETGPPTLSPVTVEGVQAGEERRIDLASSFSSPLADATPTVVSLTQVGDDSAAGETTDGSSVVLSPLEGNSGRMTWDVVMSDVDDANRPGRQASSTITLDVRDRPGQPRAPEAAAGDAEVDLSWPAPEDNGAPITSYTVTYGGDSQRCGAAPRCTVRGLTNGEDYAFTVTATNAVGDSEPSPASALVSPDAIPSTVRALSAGVPSHLKVPISWSEPAKQTSIDQYIVSWPGHRETTRGTSFSVRPASNNQKTTVSVRGQNKKGVGDERRIVVQSSGRPATPTNVTATAVDGAGEAAAVTVAWSHSNWEGPAGTYVVRRSDGRTTKAAASVHSVRESIPYNGKSYTWKVTAVNGTSTNVASHTSSAAISPAYQAADVPESPTWQTSEATGANGEGHFVFSAREVRGTQSTYTLRTARGDTSGAIGSGATIDVQRPAGENGNDVTPQVQICNKEKGCSEWVSGGTLRPYGPLGNGSVISLSTSASGQNASFRARVDSNGRPATVTVSGNRGYDRSWTVDSRDQELSDSHFVGYSSNETFTVTISDGSRGRGTRSDTSPTTDPPPRVLRAGRTGSAVGQPGCSHSSCAYITGSTQNFQGTVTCRANSSTGNGGFIPWTQGGNEQNHRSPNYFGVPGGWVTVTCDGVTSDRYYW